MRRARHRLYHTFEELGKNGQKSIDLLLIVEEGDPGDHETPPTGPEVVDIQVLSWGNDTDITIPVGDWEKFLWLIASDLVSENYQEVLNQ